MNAAAAPATGAPPTTTTADPSAPPSAVSPLPAHSHAAAAPSEDSTLIRPNYKQKFKPSIAQSILRQVLAENLAGKSYNAEECSAWTRTIADTVRHKLKELSLDRYKYMVQVVIGEMHGEGARMNCRAFWDPDTDNMAQETFMNDSLFCVAVVFGVFYY
ncbi:Tctex-1 family-domain-containing protein [Blastocladiella britannica]|nr:Tctex-1 family-domain-containing protein [Blastocladiella britannica]